MGARLEPQFRLENCMWGTFSGERFVVYASWPRLATLELVSTRGGHDAYTAAGRLRRAQAGKATVRTVGWSWDIDPKGTGREALMRMTASPVRVGRIPCANLSAVQHNNGINILRRDPIGSSPCKRIESPTGPGPLLTRSRKERESSREGYHLRHLRLKRIGIEPQITDGTDIPLAV